MTGTEKISPNLWDYADPFTVSLSVDAADIDGLGHTNNVVYVRWCEQVAWAHSVSLGLDLSAYESLDRAMAITHSEYRYLQASRLSDEVTAATWIVRWDKRFTMERRFQIVRNSDGVSLLRGAQRFACIALQSGRPKRMPPEFVEGYGPAVREIEDLPPLG
ncbi:acyl-CoA thioesterase [Halioglobus pacificus]|uniref:Acyl-CoA thioesterase n=1 Tax=Parahalioglobus pacificus TaxID=930806 RepID=A0A918XJ41_9GAMM|nr:acyl-CoA thioesterase [Halioglobus pacificus]GHD34124.1 hypothetical protein GCM10007053_19430 [Halioglobus pacificus]